MSYPAESLPVLKVSDAIQVCNQLFTDLEFSIEGEVASFSLSKGKYIFFDLKDEQEEARISCFMMAFHLSVPLEDGMRIVVHAKANIYQKSGQLRFIVNRVEPRGEGSVKRAFQLLVAKLEKEGLFARERKRVLPRFVERVGIISSVEAAGFGDFQKIAYQRLPGVQFTLVNVAVQGKDAESEICLAFDYLNELTALDAIVLIRGGGSMEDLHAFNSELVARAIVRSKSPVVVGVGHERDVTIADYCADVRAATPSNAAQLLLPTREEIEREVIRLVQAGRRQTEKALYQQQEQIKHSTQRMVQQIHFVIKQVRTEVENYQKTIEALSPTQTLRRGYSITFRQDGSLLTDPAAVQAGEKITTQLLTGSITSIIQ